MMELTRSLGELKQGGVRRWCTIVVSSWDDEFFFFKGSAAPRYLPSSPPPPSPDPAKPAIPAAKPSPTTTNRVVSSLVCARAGPPANTASASRTANSSLIVELLSRMALFQPHIKIGRAHV